MDGGGQMRLLCWKIRLPTRNLFSTCCDMLERHVQANYIGLEANTRLQAIPEAELCSS